MNIQNRKELLNKKVLEFIKERFCSHHGKTQTEFRKAKENYLSLKPFAPDGNIWESGQNIDNNTHLFMRLLTQYYLTLAFEANLIDLSNENVKEDLSCGNIGTPGRVAKCWSAKNLDDNTETLSGRWIKPPRMAYFQGEDNPNQRPVFIETQIRSVCSHHFIEFNNNPFNENSFVVVGYIPKDGVKGGISKITRFVRDFISRRAWLQEDLTEKIGKEIEKQFKTDSVYVSLKNILHGCSWTRGANDQDAKTSTIYVSGKFLDNQNLIPEKYK